MVSFYWHALPEACIIHPGAWLCVLGYRWQSFLLFFVLIIVMKIWSVIVPLRDNQHLINKSILKVLKSTVSHMLVA